MKWPSAKVSSYDGVPDQLDRLQFLARVAKRGIKHRQLTDRCVFTEPFSAARTRQLGTDIEFAERVEAFVARFSRLQDTLGDKIIPEPLRALGEPAGAAIDNLDRAERFGWLASADNWLSARQLRNQMIHEYIEDPVILASALQAGHELVPMLVETGTAVLEELAKRGWLPADSLPQPNTRTKA